ncbi:phosphogluconate dehydrogenase (NAD(+)-dependent, decarboxylating) [Allomeiothermus silvanus]|nr:decarboxylating 6-phosphogluconate dehydrogenase [Allomeiothermus silvanus]
MEKEAAMELAIIGLGRMGGNMARRLVRSGVRVVGWNRSQDVVRELAAEGMVAAESLEALPALLKAPRLVWVMLPAGEVTEQTLQQLSTILSPGDLIVDGGNANYKDSQRRGTWLEQQGFLFADVGVSGGVWGLQNGYGLMAGGSPEARMRLEPFLKLLAPAPDKGWVWAGPVGAGHFAKMVHNGIEYGMMQALAEGLAIIRKKEEFGTNLAELTEAWRYGTVIRSWLLDLTAAALAEDQDLKDIAPMVADSGEGRWTVMEAVELGVAAPVITEALYARFNSQDQEGYAYKLLAMMRKGFGGHAVQKVEG